MWKLSVVIAVCLAPLLGCGTPQTITGIGGWPLLKYYVSEQTARERLHAIRESAPDEYTRLKIVVDEAFNSANGLAEDDWTHACRLVHSILDNNDVPSSRERSHRELDRRLSLPVSFSMNCETWEGMESSLSAATGVPVVIDARAVMQYYGHPQVCGPFAMDGYEARVALWTVAMLIEARVTYCDDRAVLVDRHLSAFDLLTVPWAAAGAGQPSRSTDAGVVGEGEAKTRE
jgi:hypothetical protein